MVVADDEFVEVVVVAVNITIVVVVVVILLVVVDDKHGTEGCSSCQVIHVACRDGQGGVVKQTFNTNNPLSYLY